MSVGNLVLNGKFLAQNVEYIVDGLHPHDSAQFTLADDVEVLKKFRSGGGRFR